MKQTENGWTKESIQALLETNDRAVARAVVAIYKFQTNLEMNAGQTLITNNVGFSSVDAGLLSSFAEQAMKYGRLTPKQTAWARKKVKKYWKQLLNIASTSPVSNNARMYME